MEIRFRERGAARAALGSRSGSGGRTRARELPKISAGLFAGRSRRTGGNGGRIRESSFGKVRPPLGFRNFPHRVPRKPRPRSRASRVSARAAFRACGLERLVRDFRGSVPSVSNASFPRGNRSFGAPRFREFGFLACAGRSFFTVRDASSCAGMGNRLLRLLEFSASFTEGTSSAGIFCGAVLR